MPGPGDLFEAAQELLAVVSTAVAESPGGPIDYQAVAQGLPAFDCAPAIWVSVGGPSVANTDVGGAVLGDLQRIVTTGEVNIITFVITVIRCVTVIGQEGQTVQWPDPAQITEDARICYGDAWAIWNGVKNAHRDGTLFQTASRRREFALDPAVPVRTAGGVGGWLIQVRAQLDGYAPA